MAQNNDALARNKKVMAPPATRPPLKTVIADGEFVDGSRGEWQPLYDRRVFADGDTINEVTFFQQGHRGGRSWEDTNVPTAGQLPGGVTYSVRGAAVKLFPLEPADWNESDLVDFTQGLFTLYRGETVLLRLPLHAVAGGYGGFSGPSSGALPVLANLGTFSTNDYWKVPNRHFGMPLIAEGAFHVSLSWSAGWDIAEDWKVYVYLIGMRVIPADEG